MFATMHLNFTDVAPDRLYTSRDHESGLVNLMKERYEVINAQLYICFTF